MAGIEADNGHRSDSQQKRHLQMAALVQLRTKSGADCSAWFPEIIPALAGLPGGPHVIDGERRERAPAVWTPQGQFGQRRARPQLQFE